MEAFALSPDAPRVPLPQRLLSDERLLRLIAAGNPQAFGTVYARYHAPLYAYCRSIVRDPDDARDALQNTMMKALAALGRGGDRDISLKPWLFRIAHNESITLLRKRRPSEPLTDAISPPVGSVDGEVVARERLTQLVADLQALPERQRSALIMREVNGLSYEDIATALTISPGAARQSVFEARTALVEYGEGREVACENIRRSISDGDGRALRARRVRAHLRSCNECRDFQLTLQRRRRELAVLVPSLSGGSVVALFQGVLGAGVAGTAGGASTVGGAGLLGGSASAVLGSTAAKSVVAIVAATAAGAGAVKLESDSHTHAKSALAAGASVKHASGPTASAASAGRGAGVAAAVAAVASGPAALGRADTALDTLPGRARGSNGRSESGNAGASRGSGRRHGRRGDAFGAFGGDDAFGEDVGSGRGNGNGFNGQPRGRRGDGYGGGQGDGSGQGDDFGGGQGGDGFGGGQRDGSGQGGGDNRFAGSGQGGGDGDQPNGPRPDGSVSQQNGGGGGTVDGSPSATQTDSGTASVG